MTTPHVYEIATGFSPAAVAKKVVPLVAKGWELRGKVFFKPAGFELTPAFYDRLRKGEVPNVDTQDEMGRPLFLVEQTGGQTSASEYCQVLFPKKGTQE